jgi:hypothetical protein
MTALAFESPGVTLASTNGVGCHCIVPKLALVAKLVFRILQVA